MFAELTAREAGKASIYQSPLSGCCTLRDLSGNLFVKRAGLAKV